VAVARRDPFDPDAAPVGIDHAISVERALEQAAGDTETLIGELTYKLVADAVEVEEVEPLTLKGKAAPVAAYRLISVRAPDAAAVSTQHELVGRRQELDELLALLDEVTLAGSPQTVLVLGEAGVGKTRLLDEFVSAATDTLVLRGRCLSYGEGITFWPIVEALRLGAGVTDADDAATALTPAPFGSVTIAMPSSSRSNTPGAQNEQFPEPMQTSRSILISSTHATLPGDGYDATSRKRA